MPIEFIHPYWPAHNKIHCITTTRIGGFSKNQYESLNLGRHVSDANDLVDKNRALLKQELQLPSEPVWLNQVHGNHALEIDSKTKLNLTADASYTDKHGVVCAVLTADCLPIVFCDQKGEYVAVAHAGWRGLLKGVIENIIEKIPVDNTDLICWLGPAIGPSHFEVGREVFEDYVNKNSINENAFAVSRKEKYLANIYQLARNVLAEQNVHNIYGGEHCTYRESKKFYSFRRDGETGRMATLIWIDK